MQLRLNPPAASNHRAATTAAPDNPWPSTTAQRKEVARVSLSRFVTVVEGAGRLSLSPLEPRW